jgi:Xaa-Pro aminopeptidase
MEVSPMPNPLHTLLRHIPADMDGVMITSEANRRYYTGFASSAGTVLAFRDACYFLIDSRYVEAARQVVKTCRVILQEKRYEQISDLLRFHRIKTLGIEGDTVTLGGYRELTEKLPDVVIPMDSAVSKLISRQRRIKSADEIASMRAAQAIAEKTYDHIRQIIRVGMTEKEIALEMEMYSRQNGSEEAAFSFIVASGTNSSMPHAVPGGRRVESGDFITMDFGCTVSGYRSDMTRTLAVGEPSHKQQEVYNLVLAAQLAALDAIKPGVVCKDVDKIARDIIDNSPYKGLFGHGLGHGVGLDIHESPNFNKSDETVLEPGMVLSVEPGVYLPGEFGVRIEDVVVITPDGCENLMSSPKELIQL